jgi:stage II sporulation protein R
MRRLGHYFIYSRVVQAALVLSVLLTGLSGFPAQAAHVSAVPAANQTIPEDAIRIRIIARSDSPFDQQVKQEVRNRVSAVIGSWGAMPATHEEARALISAHLQEIRKAASAVLRENEVDYGEETVLSQVPFPDKVFGGRRYAAGDYEALRITLGEGSGTNWWCVLFPPLCLTAATAPDNSEKSVAARGTQAAPVGNTEAVDLDLPADKPEPRFFLAELFHKIAAFFLNLFS